MYSIKLNDIIDNITTLFKRLKNSKQLILYNNDNNIIYKTDSKSYVDIYHILVNYNKKYNDVNLTILY